MKFQEGEYYEVDYDSVSYYIAHNLQVKDTLKTMFPRRDTEDNHESPVGKHIDGSVHLKFLIAGLLNLIEILPHTLTGIKGVQCK